MNDRAPEPPSHDVEATLDVDPQWIAALRQDVRPPTGADVTPDPSDGPAGDDPGADVEFTVDADGELLDAIRAQQSAPGPRLADLPPPPAEGATPSAAPPAPEPTSSHPPRSDGRWTPTGRIATRAPQPTQQPDPFGTQPPAPPSRAVVVAVVVTSAVLIGGWMLFGRDAPSPPPAPVETPGDEPTGGLDDTFDDQEGNG